MDEKSYYVVHTRDGGDYDFRKKANHIRIDKDVPNLIWVESLDRRCGRQTFGIFPTDNVSWIEMIDESVSDE